MTNIVTLTGSYVWREGRSFPVDPAVVGKTLESLAEKSANGEVDAKAFVDASRSIKSPTHKLFEWNDTVAAERYREGQAARIIRSIVVVRDGEPAPTTPTFIAVTFKADEEAEDQSDSHGYVKTKELTPAQREKVILQELAQIAGWIERTAWIDEFKPFRDALERIRLALADRRKAA